MKNDKAMIDDLQIMAQAVNYRNWMFRKLTPFIGQRILEVGAGIGNFTEMFLDRQLVVPTDKFQSCVDQLKNKLHNHPKVTPLQLDLENVDKHTFKKFSFDTIVCLNVLEHIKDDLTALQSMHSILSPGGRLVLLVPAFQFLYGSIDRAIEHQRRYTRTNLLPLMCKAEFEIETSFYMNIIGMLGWFWNNRILKMQEENSAQIGIFDRYIAPWAERMEKIIPPPFGLSLIAIGRKKM